MTKTQRLVIYIYLGLLTVCFSLALLSDFLHPVTRESVLPVFKDASKTVLGALIGALSATFGRAK